MYTDNAHFVIPPPCLEQVIQPEMKAEFDIRIHGSCHENICPNPYRFSRQWGAIQKTFHKHLPGLFKLEKGDAVMEVYILKNCEETEKMPWKSMNKKFISQSLNKCEQVLHSGQPPFYSNKSFRVLVIPFHLFTR